MEKEVGGGGGARIYLGQWADESLFLYVFVHEALITLGFLRAIFTFEVLLLFLSFSHQIYKIPFF
jgi:hypothetical protein